MLCILWLAGAHAVTARGDFLDDGKLAIWAHVMPTLTAERFSAEQLSATHDSRLVLVNFWASWCGPCRREMPLLQRFAEEYSKDGLLIIGMAVDNAFEASEVVMGFNISYPVLIAGLDASALMAETGNLGGLLPFSVLLDADGEVLVTQLGELEEAELRKWIKRYL